jgi:hypothetical protein
VHKFLYIGDLCNTLKLQHITFEYLVISKYILNNLDYLINVAFFEQSTLNICTFPTTILNTITIVGHFDTIVLIVQIRVLCRKVWNVTPVPQIIIENIFQDVCERSGIHVFPTSSSFKVYST